MVGYLKQKSLYLAINILIFLVGYIFISRGICINKTSALTASIYISFGASLLASALIILLDLWKEFSKDKIFDKITNIIVEGGVVKIYKKRDIDKYDKLIQKLENNLDICGYSLNAFYESYYDILKLKIRKNKSLQVRILFVNPKTEFSKHRAALEGHTIEGVYENSFQRLLDGFKECSDNVNIKIIDAPLTTMIFRLDNTMFIGPHLHRKTSKSTVTYELDSKGWLYEEYLNEFNTMWGEARKA